MPYREKTVEKLYWSIGEVGEELGVNASLIRFWEKQFDTIKPKRTGKGRAMAAEILVVTPAIRALIRDDKIHQVYSMMQSGKKHGMQTLNDALYALYQSREVSEEECLRVSGDPVEFLRMIGKSPVDDGAPGAGAKPGAPAARR